MKNLWCICLEKLNLQRRGPLFQHIDQTGMYYGRHHKSMIVAFLQPMKVIGAQKINATFDYGIDAIQQAMLYLPIYTVNSFKNAIDRTGVT